MTMKLLELLEDDAENIYDSNVSIYVGDLAKLLKLIRTQHAIIAPLNHHSEFGGDDDIVEAIAMYNELSDKALP